MPQQKRVNSIQQVVAVQQNKLDCELIFPVGCHRSEEACYEANEEQFGSEQDAQDTMDRPPELHKHTEIAGIAGTAGSAGTAGIANHTHQRC